MLLHSSKSVVIVIVGAHVVADMYTMTEGGGRGLDFDLADGKSDRLVLCSIQIKWV